MAPNFHINLGHIGGGGSHSVVHHFSGHHTSSGHHHNSSFHHNHSNRHQRSNLENITSSLYININNGGSNGWNSSSEESICVRETVIYYIFVASLGLACGASILLYVVSRDRIETCPTNCKPQPCEMHSNTGSATYDCTCGDGSCIDRYTTSAGAALNAIGILLMMYFSIGTCFALRFAQQRQQPRRDNTYEIAMRQIPGNELLSSGRFRSVAPVSQSLPDEEMEVAIPLAHDGQVETL